MILYGLCRIIAKSVYITLLQHSEFEITLQWRNLLVARYLARTQGLIDRYHAFLLFLLSLVEFFEMHAVVESLRGDPFIHYCLLHRQSFLSATYFVL